MDSHTSSSNLVARRLAAMTSPAAQACRTTSPLAIIPIGSHEQHGPALPLGTDAWIAQAVGEKVVASEPRACLLETVPYGCSWHHTDFFGTVTVEPRTYISLLADIGTSLNRDGLVPIYLNGHGGNRAALEVTLYELAAQDVLAFGLSYFDLIAKDVPEHLPELKGSSGHACLMESSVVLHLWPDLVVHPLPQRSERPGVWPQRGLFGRSDPVVSVRLFSEVSPLGVIGDPAEASPVLGRRVFDLAVQRATEAVRMIDRTYCQPEQERST